MCACLSYKVCVVIVVSCLQFEKGTRKLRKQVNNGFNLQRVACVTVLHLTLRATTVFVRSSAIPVL